MKSFNEFLKESYSFRLGGSQQKGFDQNNQKTFAELEEGDHVFSYSQHNEVLGEFIIKEIFQHDRGIYFGFTNERFSSVIPKEALNSTSTIVKVTMPNNIEITKIYATSESEFLSAIKEMTNRDYSSKDIELRDKEE